MLAKNFTRIIFRQVSCYLIEKMGHSFGHKHAALPLLYMISTACIAEILFPFSSTGP